MGRHFDINCSTGPDVIIPVIEWLNRAATILIIMILNDGLSEIKQGCAVYKIALIDMRSIMHHNKVQVCVW